MNKYFINIWRHFKRNKIFTLVNAIGLTIGITCSLIMFVMVKFELGFDKYHENFDELYRIRTEAVNNGNLVNRIGVPKPLSEAIKADIAGLKEVAFISTGHFLQFEIQGQDEAIKNFNAYNGLVYTEPSFFRMFDWKWLMGGPEELAEPNTIALDKTTADNYFPDGEALGKFIKVVGSSDLKVVGVVEDRPDRTDFPFTTFLSLETLKAKQEFDGWFNTTSNDRCYVLLEEGRAASDINTQLVTLVDKYMSEEAELEFLLQPLTEVHFDAVGGNLNYRSVAWSLIYTLAAVSLLMILTACFNFINMSTAIAMKRAREVGIRKVLGSTRRQLIRSFLTETFAITFIAVCISLALAERLLPGIVSEFADVELSLNLWNDTLLLAYLIGLLVFITFLAGLYPAYIISAFKPANLIRGTATGVNGKSLNLRRVLIVFQFALSQVFIIGTLIVIWQMNYVKNADLGFEKERVVSLNLPSSDNNKAEVWRAVLEANAGVKDFSFAQATPFSGMTSSTDATYQKDSTDIRFTTLLKPADGQYIATYELNLLAGEGLHDLDKSNRFVVNEAFVKKLGLANPQDAVGLMIKIGGGELKPISGVVKDYHMQTLKNEVKPAAIFNNSDRYSNLGIKLQGTTHTATLTALESTWQDLYPDSNWNPVFMDDYIEGYYKRESRFFNMMVTFAIIAVLISCLGLYGMISFIANQRAKEIGIRKVLGASVVRILGLFSAEFTRLVLAAFLVAAPLAYLGMQGWLDEFVYRIQVGPAIFVTGMVMSLIITLATIGYRSLRAGLANPVDSLRDE